MHLSDAIAARFDAACLHLISEAILLYPIPRNISISGYLSNATDQTGTTAINSILHSLPTEFMLSLLLGQNN